MQGIPNSITEWPKFLLVKCITGLIQFSTAAMPDVLNNIQAQLDAMDLGSLLRIFI